ncbi:MAG: DUF4785 family protein [Lysobacteraceae bacterium]|nr:MAG: DUF4785 family protein [Xanthomonadaceae bacterium]
MRTSKFAAVAAASLVFVAGIASAARPLIPAGASDQVPLRLARLPAPAGDIERKPVSFSWALDPSAALSEPEPFLAESREYWKTVDAAEMVAGVDLPISARGALIRVSPARGAATLKASDLDLLQGGRKTGIAHIAGDAALQKAGMDVSTGTQVMKLGDQAGPGRYTLRAAKARGAYVVHVFEPQSDVVLNARADRNHALAGNDMRVAISGTRAGNGVRLQSEALLVAPDGGSRVVPVRANGYGGLEAVFTLPDDATTARGLWELQVFGDADGTPRDARTAFAVGQPTAKFSGIFGHSSASLRVSLPVEAASPGRYEARGTLYATARDGSMRPVSVAHSAAWMQAGKGMLVLQFAKAHLPRGYGAPYEVRSLELNDQSRMAPLESRARGARF